LDDRDPAGTLEDVLPKRRSFGHRYVSSLGSPFFNPIGLSFTKFSNSNRTFCNSEKDMILSSTTPIIQDFTVLIRVLQHLFSYGPSSDLQNSHSIPK
jgi:hypothetical protein